MFAIIRCRIFCFPVCYPKVKWLRYTELKFCLWPFMGVKLGRSYSGRNVGWGVLILRLRFWREYLALRGTRKQGNGENNTLKSFMICSSQPISFVWSNLQKCSGWIIQRVWETAEVYTGFWWGKQRERDHLEDPGVEGKGILRCIFRNWDVGHGLDWSVSEWVGVVRTC